jgi:hypothetical protein
MKYNYVLLGLVLLLIHSCSDDNKRSNIVYNYDFPIEKSLKGESLKEINNDFFPLFMEIKDSLMVFCDYETSPYLHVYSLPHLKHLGSFGNSGSGPNDILDPVIWGQIYNVDDSYKMWIYQMNIMKFIYIDLLESLNSNKVIPEKTVYLPPEVGANVNVISLKNDNIIGTGIEAQGEYFIFNPKDTTFNWKPFIYDFDDKYKTELINSDLLSLLKLGTIKAKPNDTLFVKSFMFYPIIDIYDINSNLILSIVNDNYEMPKINLKSSQFGENSTMYYANIFLTDEYIYALNLNCTLSEYSNNNYDDVLIDVFNWKGKSVCSYKLNEGIIQTGAFSVDEKNNKIYITNPKSEFDYYTVFDIN